MSLLFGLILALFRAGGFMEQVKAIFIDDSQRALDIMERANKRLSLRAVYTTEIEAAKSYIGMHESIKYVFVDLKMPGMNGFEASKYLQAFFAGRDLRFICISSFGELSYVKKAIELGFSDYILKPLDLDVYQAKIGKYLSLGDNKLFEKKVEIPLRTTLMPPLIEHTLIGLTELGGKFTSSCQYNINSVVSLKCPDLNFLYNQEDVINVKIISCSKYRGEFLIGFEFLDLRYGTVQKLRSVVIN